LEAWGVEQIDTNVYAMDIATFTEWMLGHALEAMDSIIRLTPVESLPDAAPQPVGQPIYDERADTVQRIRFLSGLA
jgi:hypothetical protein